MKRVAKIIIIGEERRKKSQIIRFHAIFKAQVPFLNLFRILQMRKKLFSVNTILVNLIEILGHLCGITEKLRVHFDEFKDNFNIINELQAAPFFHGLLDGEYLRHPKIGFYGLCKLGSQLQGGTFVRENNGDGLLRQIVMTCNTITYLLDESHNSAFFSCSCVPKSNQ